MELTMCTSCQTWIPFFQAWSH